MKLFFNSNENDSKFYVFKYCIKSSFKRIFIFIQILFKYFGRFTLIKNSFFEKGFLDIYNKKNIHDILLIASGVKFLPFNSNLIA